MILKGNPPYRLIDQDYFKQFVKAFHHEKKLIDRKTLSEIIAAKTRELRDKIIDDPQKVDTIALTFDSWTAKRRSMGFASLTGHCIKTFR